MALVYFCLLPILSLLVLPKLLRKIKSRQPHRYPPGPRALPFIGNLHQLDLSIFAHQLWKLSKQYGPIMHLRLGYIPVVVISSSEMAKQFLKTHDINFCSRPIVYGMRKVSYNSCGVVSSPYNAHWREMRKIVAVHLFSSKRVLSFRSIREEVVFQMIKEISEKASTNEVVNLTDIMLLLTNTITCRVAFGKKFDEVDSTRLGKLLKRFEAVTTSFYFSDFFPSLGGLDNLVGSSAELDKFVSDMDMFYQELIDQHLSPSRPSSMAGDVIDILLQLKKADDQLSSTDITIDKIKAIIMDLFFGGTESTAHTIIWTMTNLIKNPGVMHKAQDEVRKLMHGKERIYEEDLKNIRLPYLDAAIKESMRLYPVFPLFPRESIDRKVVNGYEIEAKATVYVNVLAIGRDPQVWEYPDEFLPERFLESDIQFYGQDFEFIPFGTGRRICSGIYMAESILELALSNLLYSFEWELPPGINTEDIDTESVHGITMHKKNDLCLIAKNY